jgi:competence protein ComEA
MAGWRDAIVVWFAVIVLVLTVAVGLYQWRDRDSAPAIIVLPGLQATSIAVEIAGAVANPGIYDLPVRSRVGDAIEAAGGISLSADLSGINRAAYLMDGQKITIPVLAADGSEQPEPVATGIININTATADELDALPGIGEVRAQAIVDYRNQNGPFGSVDELLAVEGISQSVLDGLRDLVTVGV